MAEATKQVSIMCFHDELCQVFNALHKDGMLVARYSRQGFAQASSELPDVGAE